MSFLSSALFCVAYHRINNSQNITPIIWGQLGDPISQLCAFDLIACIQDVGQNHIGCDAQHVHDINESVQSRNLFAAFQQTDVVYTQIDFFSQIFLPPFPLLAITPNIFTNGLQIHCDSSRQYKTHTNSIGGWEKLPNKIMVIYYN